MVNYYININQNKWKRYLFKKNLSEAQYIKCFEN